MTDRRPDAPPLSLAALLCVVCAGLAGCAEGGAGPKRVTGVLPAEFDAWAPPRGVFLPVRLRVHPLTRLTRDPGGGAVLACHVELRDSFGQIVRCLGIAQVELLAADGQGNIEGEALRVWQVDLRDPEGNAAAFDDVVTRTYALRLGALPPEAARLADSTGEGTSYAVRVRFLFKNAAGESRQLDAEMPIISP